MIGTGWKVKKADDNCIKCSLVKEPIIFIEPTPRRKIELLMNKYLNQEWLGYLVGRMSEKENFFVEDLAIPPHKEAYGASAEAEPFNIPDKCIGVIHSHHSMGAFHSQTDQDYVDKNFPVSITVAIRKEGGLEFDAVSYQTTLCGKDTTSKGTVKYVAPEPGFDTEVFMKEAESNIDRGKMVYRYQVPHHLPNRVPLYTQTGSPAYHKKHGRRGKYAGEGYFTAENGRVMTQQEIDNHMKGIFED